MIAKKQTKIVLHKIVGEKMEFLNVAWQSKYKQIRRLGRFACIFYFSCGHFFFVHCKTIKKFMDFIKKNVADFKILMKIELCWRNFDHP